MIKIVLTFTQNDLTLVEIYTVVLHFGLDTCQIKLAKTAGCCYSCSGWAIWSHLTTHCAHNHNHNVVITVIISLYHKIVKSFILRQRSYTELYSKSNM